MKTSLIIALVGLFSVSAFAGATDQSISNNQLFDDLGISWWHFRVPEEIHEDSALSVIFCDSSGAEHRVLSLSPVKPNQQARVYFDFSRKAFLIRFDDGGGGGVTHDPEVTTEGTVRDFTIERSGGFLVENVMFVSISDVTNVANGSPRAISGYLIRIETVKAANQALQTTRTAAQ